MTPTQTAALPHFAHERAQTFAICSGRLSALAVRQAAQGDPTAEESRRLLGDFDMLLEATLDAALAEGVPEDQPKVWKARGWSEIAYLLHEVQYSFDQGRADRASEQLGRHISHCRELILPGV